MKKLLLLVATLVFAGSAFAQSVETRKITLKKERLNINKNDLQLMGAEGQNQPAVQKTTADCENILTDTLIHLPYISKRSYFTDQLFGSFINNQEPFGTITYQNGGEEDIYPTNAFQRIEFEAAGYDSVIVDQASVFFFQRVMGGTAEAIASRVLAPVNFGTGVDTSASAVLASVEAFVDLGSSGGVVNLQSNPQNGFYLSEPDTTLPLASNPSSFFEYTNEVNILDNNAVAGKNEFWVSLDYGPYDSKIDTLSTFATDTAADGITDFYITVEGDSSGNVQLLSPLTDFTDGNDLEMEVIPRLRMVICDDGPSSRENAFVRINDLKMYAIYPNPAADQANIKFELASASSQAKLTVLDQLGRVVYESELGSHLPDMTYEHQFDVSHLATGRYTVRLVTDAGAMAQPMIKR